MSWNWYGTRRNIFFQSTLYLIIAPRRFSPPLAVEERILRGDWYFISDGAPCVRCVPGAYHGQVPAAGERTHVALPLPAMLRLSVGPRQAAFLLHQGRQRLLQGGLWKVSHLQLFFFLVNSSDWILIVDKLNLSQICGWYFSALFVSIVWMKCYLRTIVTIHLPSVFSSSTRFPNVSIIISDLTGIINGSKGLSTYERLDRNGRKANVAQTRGDVGTRLLREASRPKN